MKYLLSIFIVFVFNCDKNPHINIDFCEILDHIYQVQRKENNSISRPFIVDKIKKIDNSTIQSYLISSSEKFRNYNFNDYFNNDNPTKDYHFDCDIIEFDSFYIRMNNHQTSKEQTIISAEIKYVQFFEPIFSNEQNEFILLIMEYRSDFKFNYRLVQYSLKDGEIKLIKELLVSN